MCAIAFDWQFLLETEFIYKYYALLNATYSLFMARNAYHYFRIKYIKLYAFDYPCHCFALHWFVSPPLFRIFQILLNLDLHFVIVTIHLIQTLLFISVSILRTLNSQYHAFSLLLYMEWSSWIEHRRHRGGQQWWRHNVLHFPSEQCFIRVDITWYELASLNLINFWWK